jgi:hypothetical protein
VRVLRDSREVAQLWLCERFVPAFHFTSGRDPAKFRQIMRTGALIPSAGIGRDNLFNYDVLAGDDNYVFLSVNVPSPGGTTPPQYGFVFDALQLVQEGALVGQGDMLYQYGVELAAILRKHNWNLDQIGSATNAGHQRFTPESMQFFLQRRNSFWSDDLGNPDKVINHIPELIEGMTRLQNDFRYSGKPATDLVVRWAEKVCAYTRGIVEDSAKIYRSYAKDRSHPPDAEERSKCRSLLHLRAIGRKLTVRDSPELLWPGRLPLSKAIAAISLSDNDSLFYPDTLTHLFCG